MKILLSGIEAFFTKQSLYDTIMPANGRLCQEKAAGKRLGKEITK